MSDVYYRGGGGGGGGYGGGQGYAGQESSSASAFRAHEEKKARDAKQQQALAVAGGACVCVLLLLVWALSGRGNIPQAYTDECQRACPDENFLCDTICKNLPAHYADEELVVACQRGCRDFGIQACRRACASNDRERCGREMAREDPRAMCDVFDPEPDRASPHKACVIGAQAVSKTDWPCRVGVTRIGKILSAHKS